MIKIPLTLGLFAFIDDEDECAVFGSWWHAVKSKKTFYAKRTDGMKLHNLVFPAPAGMLVDHIDRNGLNNQKTNLRHCYHWQNCANNSRPFGKYGFKGVYLAGVKKKFQASVRVQGKNISLGYYATPEEAAVAYDEGALKYFGEFARLNFPQRRAAA